MSRLAVGDPAPAFDHDRRRRQRVSAATRSPARATSSTSTRRTTRPAAPPRPAALRDSWSRVAETGVELFGVSPDSVKSHVKFREKYALPYRLLSDQGHQVAEAFGVWVEKTFAGRTYFGNERTTFVDRAGRADRARPGPGQGRRAPRPAHGRAGRVKDRGARRRGERRGRIGPASRRAGGARARRRSSHPDSAELASRSTVARQARKRSPSRLARNLRYVHCAERLEARMEG